MPRDYATPRDVEQELMTAAGYVVRNCGSGPQRAAVLTQLARSAAGRATLGRVRTPALERAVEAEASRLLIAMRKRGWL